MIRQLGPRRPPASFQIRKKGKDSMKPSMWPIRTPLRPTEQSPPRSRAADLPSNGSLISASLEAVSRHKGQTAPPPNRPPYKGIKGQPLRHGSKDGRCQTATPAVDVT